MSLREIEALAVQLQTDISHEESGNKRARLAAWGANTTDVPKRDLQIDRKYCTLYPAVKQDGKAPITKDEAITGLQQYTRHLHNRSPDLAAHWESKMAALSMGIPGVQDCMSSCRAGRLDSEGSEGIAL